MLYSIQNDNKELCKTMPEVNRLAGSGVEALKRPWSRRLKGTQSNVQNQNN